MFSKVDGSENLTVDFEGSFEGELVDLIGELVEEFVSFGTSFLKIGSTFKGVFHAEFAAVERCFPRRVCCS